MIVTKKTTFAIIALVAALLAGCEKPPTLPEVNEENCHPENIAKLAKGVQQEFSSQCLRRGTFQPSEQKTW